MGKKRFSFKLDAPNAQAVFVAGSFNQWDPESHPLKLDKNGLWKTQISLAPGKYEYRFVVDGQWQEDPACEVYCPNGFGEQNSVVSL